VNDEDLEKLKKFTDDFGQEGWWQMLASFARLWLTLTLLLLYIVFCSVSVKYSRRYFIVLIKSGLTCRGRI